MVGKCDLHGGEEHGRVVGLERGHDGADLGALDPLTSNQSNEESPAELLLSRLIPIFKNKGSAADANNYRGIALMSLCAKLRNKMLLQLLLLLL